ncbi:MAG: winged helix-turn-helix transcriptional regulator [Acholeplasmataceae bacterium]|nr:winged helix-turn-helix transcriptional regulator [Acholeplasmataceae bacterium]
MKPSFAFMFKSLSDENRIKILELLIQGETCGCTLIDKLTIKQPTLSYHLKILAESGLTKTFKEGNWVKHHVDKDKIDAMIDFLINLKNMDTTCKS